MRGELSLISGRSNPPLAATIAHNLGVELRACDVRRFADGELMVEIEDNVRGHDVFVIQSTSTPGNDYIMELLIIIDALRRASAERITAVLPYYGYARQDRKSKPRVPITAKLVADLIVTSGAHRVLTMDLHSGQIMGFFNIPVDNLYARPVFLKYLRDICPDDEICVVSPDGGGVPRARGYAKRLDVDLAIIDKRRTTPNQVAEMRVVGDVEGRVAVLVDDIVDTGGTLVKATEALLDAGAKAVYACCTHAVLSGDAKERINSSKMAKLLVSDSIFQPDLAGADGRIAQVSVAPVISDAIGRIHRDESVSFLFSGD